MGSSAAEGAENWTRTCVAAQITACSSEDTISAARGGYSQAALSGDSGQDRCAKAQEHEPTRGFEDIPNLAFARAARLTNLIPKWSVKGMRSRVQASSRSGMEDQEPLFEV